jgi:hypothetical protein
MIDSGKETIRSFQLLSTPPADGNGLVFPGILVMLLDKLPAVSYDNRKHGRYHTIAVHKQGR